MYSKPDWRKTGLFPEKISIKYKSLIPLTNQGTGQGLQ